jgi:hypothetical protein
MDSRLPTLEYRGAVERDWGTSPDDSVLDNPMSGDGVLFGVRPCALPIGTTKARRQLRTRRAVLHAVRAGIAAQARTMTERAWVCFARASRLIPGKE